MKELFGIGILSFVFLFFAGKYGLWKEFEDRAKTVHNYEYKALEYAKKVRLLEKENNNLRAQIQKLNAQKEHLLLSQSNKVARRTISSVAKVTSNDLVKFSTYKWSPGKLLSVGQAALKNKEFEKSAQYLHTLIEQYPNYEKLNDEVLFQAGISAYETGKYLDWSIQHFDSLVNTFPKSKLYRGAKLWLAISRYKKGDEQYFMKTVDEFKLKYRNTNEWKILAKFYEELAYKYKK